MCLLNSYNDCISEKSMDENVVVKDQRIDSRCVSEHILKNILTVLEKEGLVISGFFGKI